VKYTKKHAPNENQYRSLVKAVRFFLQERI